MAAPQSAETSRPDPRPLSAPIIDPETVGLSAAAGPCQSGPGAPADAPRRRLTTTAGTIEAWVDGPILRASGLRYATAHRYAPPRPVRAAREGEIIDATRFAPQPPQLVDERNSAVLGTHDRGLVEAEDCLFLSIAMPADHEPASREDLLPVMVWIHGGGYETGAADSPYFDPTDLIAEQRVLTVHIGYRLGLLGCLGGDDRASNLFLRDQAEALRWVRRHIESFGGDSTNITLFGESAGADSVLHLLASHEPGELCDRVIVQSPPLGITTGRTRMTRAMRAIAQRNPAGRPVWGSAAADAVPSAQQVLDLQARITRAVGGTASRYGLRGSMCWGAVYGEHPLPAEDERTRAWAEAAAVPMLIGSTGQEAAFFTYDMPGLADLRRLPRVGEDLYRSAVRRLSDVCFDDAIDGITRLWRSVGGDATRYRATWAAPGNPIGSAHTVELALMLGTPERYATAEILRGATAEEIDDAGRELRSIWADFARGEEVRGRDVAGLISLR